ncbi:phosphomannomutase/phosphoglucomutase [Candidatus Parcubacteria bacterium]|nr:phosphomannomutase/phosphoglucomutase [Candidatus Parcubacteria bacterium]
MKTNPEIFKAYDIRGIYGQDLNGETAYILGQAYVELRRKDGKTGELNIVVAEDMRLSSPQLKLSLVKGLTDAGANVVDIGLASTPSFYFAVANYGYDGGIIVSASHNPAEWNGFKLVRERALPVSGESGIYFLRDKVIEGNFKSAKITGKIFKKRDVLKDQINHDLQFADLAKIKPLKIVVDPANGMGAQYIEELFKHLPCELIKMNFKLDGTFPAHEADPIKEENLIYLQKTVMKEKADLGIAIDGDGDRIFFVDNNGEAINQAITRGVLAMIFLREKPGAKICYDIRPGRITRDLIEENGGIPIVTRVGHSLIKEQAIKEGAYFAGESSGHFFLNTELGCFEVPVIIILKLLQEFSQSGKTVAEFIAPYKKYYHSGEINSVVENKEEVFAKIEKMYKDGEANKLDGITIEYPDFWFNVRGSNTELKLRLNLEAKTKEIMEEKRDEVLKIILGNKTN